MGVTVVMSLNIFSTKMHDDRKIRGIKSSEFALIVSSKNCSLKIRQRLYTKAVFKRNSDSSFSGQITRLLRDEMLKRSILMLR